MKALGTHSRCVFKQTRHIDVVLPITFLVKCFMILGFSHCISEIFC